MTNILFSNNESMQQCSLYLTHTRTVEDLHKMHKAYTVSILNKCFFLSSDRFNVENCLWSFRALGKDFLCLNVHKICGGG